MEYIGRFRFKWCVWEGRRWGDRENRPNRRRINTEDKAKVVAAVWGTELIHLLAALAVLH